jgi:hypothetical protein
MLVEFSSNRSRNGTLLRAASLISPAQQARRLRTILAWLLISTTLLYVFTAGSNFSSGDSFSELRVTDSLLAHGQVNVPVQQPGQTCAGWGCRGRDGRFYATHGIGYSLYLIPFFLIATRVEAVGGMPACADWTHCVPIHLLSWNTCLLSALTVCLLLIFALELGYSLRRALTLALLYGFATLAWPYARFGFDVTLTALLILAAVRYTWLAGRAGPGRAALGYWTRAGILSGLVVLVRLPSLAAILPLAALCVVDVLRARTRQSVGNLAGFAVPVVIALAFTGWYNFMRFGSALDDGHRLNAADRLSSAPWVGLAGMFISPGKGLIWYCPVLLLAIAATPAFLRARPHASLVAGSVSLISMLPYAFVNDWYGGSAWGPRFFLPVLPLLCLPLLELPAVIAGSPFRKAIAFAVIGVSVVIQLAGQLVSYPDRLALANKLGYGSDIFWNVRRSPLIDQLGTVVTYVRHLAWMSYPVPETQSFDIWWLNLWRIDGLQPSSIVLAGFAVGMMAVLAAARLLTFVARADGSYT